MILYFKNHIAQKWLLIFLAIFFVLSALLAGAFLIFEKKYAHKFYPGTYIANIDVSGLSAEQTKNLLNNKVNLINQNGIKFQYRENSAILFPLIASIETDLAYEIINFDIEKSINEINKFGRGNSFFNNLKEKIITLKEKKYFGIYYTVNEEELNKFLINNFSALAEPAQNANLIYLPGNYYKAPVFEIKKEKYGQAINYNQAISALKTNLQTLNDSDIILESKIDYPGIYKKDALNIDAKAKKLLTKTPFYLFYNENEWEINKAEFIKWLTLKNNFNASSTDKVLVGLDKEKVKEYLTINIIPKIETEPVEAKFKIKNNRVEEFQASRDGLALDMLNSINTIELKLINSTSSKIELTMKKLKSKTQTKEVNDLGIKEIIGIGHSNFSGSPKNRRHNIAVGAAAVNGTLTKPGEEFSLNSVLGEINAETGYLPELVIKDNKTLPEYGGGLCQIGTTMFRGTIESGLSVTMRRNHSYRVSYYEPAGTDATIYSPWPDYKFLNNTDNYILIQSRIEGNDIYFEFWGTKDERIVEKTEPTIYNITRPGPTKIIETLDLEPGEKKCTEHAHNGADAYFDYAVTYADGTVNETRFKSHYMPWREVCLLGVKELTSEKEKTATSTAAVN